MAHTRAAFRRWFLASPPDERLSFLADLYAAQGWQVRRLDAGIQVRRPSGGPAKTVTMGDGPAVPDADADVVVVADDAADVEAADGVTVVDAAALYDRVRYGVERDASERLLATHLDEVVADEPAEPEAVGPTAADDSHPADGRTGPSPRTRRALLVGAGAAMGGAAALVGSDVFGGPPAVRAPGVTRDGIEDSGRLSEAHMSAIQTASYALELGHVQRDDDLGIRAAYGLDLSLSAGRAFQALVSTDGPEAPLVLGDPPAKSRFYSDGQQHFVDHAPDRDEGAVAFDPPGGFVGTWNYWAFLFPFGGEIGSTPELFYRTVFDSIPTRLAETRQSDDRETYRLASTGTTATDPIDDLPGRDVRDVDLRALVDDRGLVRRFDVDYRAIVGSTPSRISRRIRYTSVGETEVRRPDWVG